MAKEAILVYDQPATHYTIQMARDHGQEELGYSLYAWGVYPSHSVLAGQPCKRFVNNYKTMEEAQSDYPDAKFSNPLTEPQNTFDHLPHEDDPYDPCANW